MDASSSLAPGSGVCSPEPKSCALGRASLKAVNGRTEEDATHVRFCRLCVVARALEAPTFAVISHFTKENHDKCSCYQHSAAALTSVTLTTSRDPTPLRFTLEAWPGQGF